MKTSRPESSSTARVKLSVGAAACGIALTLRDRQPQSRLAGPTRCLRPAALGRVGLDLRRPRVRCAARLSLFHGLRHLASPERCLSRSKKVGTARSIASPPEIPSQLTLIAPTSP